MILKTLSKRSVDYMDLYLNLDNMDYITINKHDFKILYDYYNKGVAQINDLEQENERLNNMIEELEKELKKDMEVYICGKSNGKTFKFVEKIVKAYYLDKLKELKEGK